MVQGNGINILVQCAPLRKQGAHCTSTHSSYPPTISLGTHPLYLVGVYSYTEHTLRRKLSYVFDACIEARACRSCQHSRSSRHPQTLILNFAFSLLTMFHLAYLGVMFDSNGEESTGYSMLHTLKKWKALDFASHWVAMGTFIFAWLL